MSEITPAEKVAKLLAHDDGGIYDEALDGWVTLQPDQATVQVKVAHHDDDGEEVPERARHFRAVVVEGAEPPALLTATLAEIARERDEQNATMDGLTPPDGTGDEHYQEIAQDARRAAFEAFRDGEGTWVHIFAETTSRAFTESDPAKLRARLVKVAAETVCWIEALDRRIAAEASQAEQNGGKS